MTRTPAVSLLTTCLLFAVLLSVVGCAADGEEAVDGDGATDGDEATNGDEAADTGSEEQASEPSEDGADDEDAAGDFPLTLEHRHGTTEVAAPPERVVTVGLTDHDAFLALGHEPVGITDWYGDQPDALWPWARDALQGEAPEVVGTAEELDFEAIAALEPDLIVGLYSALSEDDYDTLSQIAPTVAQPDEHVDWGVPWQELTRTVGRIVGEPDEAQARIEEIEDGFATAREEHPDLNGASAAIATPSDGIYVYSPDVANVRLLRELGMEIPEGIAELVGEADGAELSLERVDLLDVDALVWLDAQQDEGPLGEPLYQQLAVHTEGREVLVSSASELGAAMSFSSVLSLEIVLEELVPRLDAAVDGDPETTVEPALEPAE
ncbi:MAG: iron-siderophore ABC transporter substrate-binding protein [Actinomycetota bacterium]